MFSFFFSTPPCLTRFYDLVFTPIHPAYPPALKQIFTTAEIVVLHLPDLRFRFCAIDGQRLDLGFFTRRKWLFNRAERITRLLFFFFGGSIIFFLDKPTSFESLQTCFFLGCHLCFLMNSLYFLMKLTTDSCLIILDHL